MYGWPETRMQLYDLFIGGVPGLRPLLVLGGNLGTVRAAFRLRIGRAGDAPGMRPPFSAHPAPADPSRPTRRTVSHRIVRNIACFRTRGRGGLGGGGQTNEGPPAPLKGHRGYAHLYAGAPRRDTYPIVSGCGAIWPSLAHREYAATSFGE